MLRHAATDQHVRLAVPVQIGDGNTGLYGIVANLAELLWREDRFDRLARPEPAVLQAAEHVETPLLAAIGAGDEVHAAVPVVVRQLRTEHAVASAVGGSSGRHLVVEPDRLGEPRFGLAAEIPVDPQAPSLPLSAFKLSMALADKEIRFAVPVEIADPGGRVPVFVGLVNGNTADRDRKRWGQARGVAGSRREGCRRTARQEQCGDEREYSHRLRRG